MTKFSALALVLLVLPRVALADPVAGTGRDGPLVVDRDGLVVNGYAAVALDAAAGATKITVTDGSPFSAGDFVLIWQAQDDVAVTSGDPSAVALAGRLAGTHQSIRVASRDKNVLTLEAPLARAAKAKQVQIVRVPEYTKVSIPESRSITGRSWNGETGGIVAFLASEGIELGGEIDADALGGRGGKLTNIAKHYGCATKPPFDGSPFDGFAHKGEGVIGSWATWAEIGGKGNIANAAGGGNCHNGGGAGGAHIGLGGHGGFGWPGAADDGGSRDVGGLGGSALQYDIAEHLLFGAGGGAGESNNGTGTAGGDGGGVVYVTASSITGKGTVHADGASALAAGPDGAGGGGAGGTVLLIVEGPATIDAISTHGGSGGDAGDDPGEADGSGGGGGGGRIRVSATIHAYETDVGAGIAGVQSNASWTGGLHRGATPDASDDPSFVGLADRLVPSSAAHVGLDITPVTSKAVTTETAAPRTQAAENAPDAEVLWKGSCATGHGRSSGLGLGLVAAAMLIARRRAKR